MGLDELVTYLIYPLLILIAFLYASVGHGGASGYIAIMALYGFAPTVIRSTALVLNILVSIIGFISFYRNGFFNKRIFIPLIISSVPMAYLGGLMPLENHIYKIVLGLILLIPAIRFSGIIKSSINYSKKHYSVPGLVIIGGLIGLISGMTGIGGGIILSPLLILLRWTDMKQTAALSAGFIFLNSIAGLTGMMQQGLNFNMDIIAFIIPALIGGIAGAHFGAGKFNTTILSGILGIVLLIASLKLLFT